MHYKTRSRTCSPHSLPANVEHVPAPKPKPAYKNADRATYFRDEVTGQKYYQCPLCPKRLKGHLTIHLRTHTGSKPWKCSKCSKSFSQKCNLQTHTKAVHETVKLFKCELCSNSFDYKKNLERHISSHLLERPYKCPYCPRRFTSVDWLCKHKRIHTGETPYQCVFCPKVKFAQYSQMISHLRRHIGERPYSCKFCDKAFTLSGDRNNHIRSVHLLKVDRATCLFCERIFLNDNRLFDHVRRSHIGEGPNSYRRSQFSTIKKGKRILTKYECAAPNCEKVYKESSGLKRHWLTHHIPDKERPFSCQFCDKSFVEFCFLRDHLVTHTNERPEKCHVCLKRFRWKSTLRSHLTSHRRNK